MNNQAPGERLVTRFPKIYGDFIQSIFSHTVKTRKARAKENKNQFQENISEAGQRCVMRDERGNEKKNKAIARLIKEMRGARRTTMKTSENI